MIATLNVKVVSANPNIPLKECIAFKNSPISVRIIDVPKKIGQWQITEVYFNVRFPDNQVKSKKAALVAGAYVCTVAGSSVSGSVSNGYTVTANGRDENGNSVTGYVLGCGNVKIMQMDGSITPGIDQTFLRLLDEEPQTPREGDVIDDGGNYKVYHGESWQPFADVDSYLTNYYTKTQTNTLLANKAEVSSVYTKSEVDARIPTKVSDLTNDTGYITSSALNAYSTTTQMNTAIANVTDPMRSDIDDMFVSIGVIGAKIPEQATSENQLADKNFVNSSITTNTATFRGTFNSIQELPSTGITNNDYAFVIRTDSVGQTFYDRYKYAFVEQGVGYWQFEYSINNSGFTAAQYASINSGVTETDVAQIWTNAGNISIKANSGDVYTRDQLYTQEQVNTLLSLKANATDVYAKSAIGTFVLSGTYEDDTTFSFNVMHLL